MNPQRIRKTITVGDAIRHEACESWVEFLQTRYPRGYPVDYKHIFRAVRNNWPWQWVVSHLLTTRGRRNMTITLIAANKAYAAGRINFMQWAERITVKLLKALQTERSD